jgi:hypothetical protein
MLFSECLGYVQAHFLGSRAYHHTIPTMEIRLYIMSQYVSLEKVCNESKLEKPARAETYHTIRPYNNSRLDALGSFWFESRVVFLFAFLPDIGEKWRRPPCSLNRALLGCPFILGWCRHGWRCFATSTKWSRICFHPLVAIRLMAMPSNPKCTRLRQNLNPVFFEDRNFRMGVWIPPTKIVSIKSCVVNRQFP